MVKISGLIVTHNDLRNPASLPEMIRYVGQGGFWTETDLASFSKSQRLGRTSPLIQLSRFEDDLIYLHDGHHRTAATYLGGRDYLRDDEYHISDWRYSDYELLSHEKGWYTPFDPRTHVRTPDFGYFKHEARQRFLDGASVEDVAKWIADNEARYREPRRFFVLRELASRYRDLAA